VLLPTVLLVIAFALVVTGVATFSTGTGFVVAGLLLGLAALYVDPASLKRKGGRR